jgi:hypothetical protein
VKLLPAILLILFTAYLYKPLSDLRTGGDKMECCHKDPCKTHNSGSEKKDCGNTGCNMLSCAFGNVYINASGELHFRMLPVTAGELHAQNDNQLRFVSRDCWHPPKQS